MISEVFHEILYRPLFNALILLYQFLPFHDLGVAIILLTFLIRIVLYPLSTSSLKAQKKISNLQPKINEIQKKIKDSKEKTEAILKLYQKEKINPFGGILPLLLQIPILIALYRVFFQVQEIDPALLYGFVLNPGNLNPNFLGILNLINASLPLAILAGILQFIQAKAISTKSTGADSDVSKMIQKQSLYIFPLLTFFILSRLPSAVGLYWITTIIFSLGEQRIIFKDTKT